MKRAMTAAALMGLALCAAAPASAQLLEVSVSGMGTYWDTDDLGDAFGPQLGVEVAFFDWLSAEARTGYLRADDHELNIVPVEVMAAFRLSILDVVEPYGGLGAGRYFLSSDEISTTDREALFPLVGLDVHLPTTKLTLFAEARWMFFSDSISDDLPSANLDGLAFSAGLSWSF